VVGFYVIPAVALLLFVAALPGGDAPEHARGSISSFTRWKPRAGMKFIRNATEHDGAAAAKDLRRKFGGGARVATAQDLEKMCASESSLGDQKYKVKLAAGTVLDAAVAYFEAELRKFDRTSS
jgi:hypothetical protein